MRAMPPADSLWYRLRWPALLITLVFAYGISGYMVLEGWTFVEALYMTFITLTTVGFREVRPLDVDGKLFTISLIFLGVTIFLVTLTLIATWLMEAGIGERRRRRRMQRRIDSLKGHFVLCAYGRVGRAAARELEHERVEFVVIDSDPDLEPRMIEDRVPYLIGDPTGEGVLRNAGLERARGLICAVDSDATNVFITLMARSINENVFIVARASERLSIDRLRQAGADRVISPYVTSGNHMALLAQRPHLLGYMEMETRHDRTLRIDEIQVEKGSRLRGLTAAEACPDVTVLAIGKTDGNVVPHPDGETRLEAGDLLVVMGSEEALRRVEEG
jgi:voltage-gated potassium channel